MPKKLEPDDVRNMDEDEMQRLLCDDCGEDPSDLLKMKRQDLIDLIVEHHSGLDELHSDCQGGHLVHPDENEEDFSDHEDPLK